MNGEIYLSPFIIIKTVKTIKTTETFKWCPKCDKKLQFGGTYCIDCGSGATEKDIVENHPADFWEFIEEFQEFDGVFYFNDIQNDEIVIIPSDSNISGDDLMDRRDYIVIENINGEDKIKEFKNTNSYKEAIKAIETFFGKENIKYHFGIVGIEY